MSLKHVSLFLAFSVLGCATVGSQFDFQGPDSLQLGKTSKNQIIRSYGQPFRAGYDNGDLVWTYGFYKYRLFGSTDTKDLQISFDKKGFVKNYIYATSIRDEKERLLLTTTE